MLEAGLIAGEVSQDRGRRQLLGDGLGESVPGGVWGVSDRQVHERHDPADLREAGAEDDGTGTPRESRIRRETDPGCVEETGGVAVSGKKDTSRLSTGPALGKPTCIVRKDFFGFFDHPV